MHGVPVRIQGISLGELSYRVHANEHSYLQILGLV